MTQSTIDIEQVVREVLRELELATAQEAPAPTKPAPAPKTASPLQSAPAAAASGALVMRMPVVTLAALEGRLDGVRQIVVSPGTVVTPSVHDELYRRNVTLSFASAEAKPQAIALRLVLVVAGKKFDSAQLLAALQGMSLEVESTSLDCLMASSDRLAQEVAKENTLGVLITRHVHAALCLTNRLAGVRAVAAGDAGKIAAAAEAIGANVLILDPHCGLFAMKRMIDEFCRGGVRQCPEVFRKKLA